MIFSLPNGFVELHNLHEFVGICRRRNVHLRYFCLKNLDQSIRPVRAEAQFPLANVFAASSIGISRRSVLISVFHAHRLPARRDGPRVTRALPIHSGQYVSRRRTARDCKFPQLPPASRIHDLERLPQCVVQFPSRPYLSLQSAVNHADAKRESLRPAVIPERHRTSGGRVASWPCCTRLRESGRLW